MHVILLKKAFRFEEFKYNSEFKLSNLGHSYSKGRVTDDHWCVEVDSFAKNTGKIAGAWKRGECERFAKNEP